MRAQHDRCYDLNNFKLEGTYKNSQFFNKISTQAHVDKRVSCRRTKQVYPQRDICSSLSHSFLAVSTGSELPQHVVRHKTRQWQKQHQSQILIVSIPPKLKPTAIKIFGLLQGVEALRYYVLNGLLRALYCLLIWKLGLLCVTMLWYRRN